MQQGNVSSVDKKIIPVSVIDELAADCSDRIVVLHEAADIGCLVSLCFRELKELCWYNGAKY